jgi:hypothetical protein
MSRAVVIAAAVVVSLVPVPAGAQTPRLRLAAPGDCQRNPNCVPGLRRVYRFDPSGSLVRLKAADAGIQALDDGLAEVAVAFTSTPQASRPDIRTLRDDRHMITADHVVPIVRTALLKRYGRPLRRRLNAASRLLTTLQLRGLNQQVIDGRLPEAVAGESSTPTRSAATRRGHARARRSLSGSRTSPRTRPSPTCTPRRSAGPASV